MNAKGNDRLNSLQRLGIFGPYNISIDKLTEVRGFENVRLSVEVEKSRGQW